MTACKQIETTLRQW